MRRVRTPDCGLLLLYVIDPEKSGFPQSGDIEGVVAVAVSFPGSTSGVKVEYKANSVLWGQETGWLE